MSILGKLAKGTGYLACGLGGVTIALTGSIVGGIGKTIMPESTLFDDIQDLSNKAGNALIDASSSVGKFAECAVDTTFKVSGDIGGGIAGGIVEIAGGSFEDVEKARKVGRFVGGATVGLFIGDAIGGATTTIAGLGTAGTGTAITSLHGAAHTSAVMSNIGGGTIMSGGAGVLGGYTVLNTVNAVCIADGGIKSLTSDQADDSIIDQDQSYKIEMLVNDQIWE